MTESERSVDRTELNLKGEFKMQPKIIVLPIALFLSLGALVNFGCARKRESQTRTEQTQPSGPFVLDVQVPTGYKSLCDLKPQLTPKSANVGPGASWSISSGCADFDSKPFVPLIVRVKNQSPEKTKFKLPLLSEVTVNTDTGPQPASAFYVPWGSAKGFASTVEGDIEVDVSSEETIELLYLLPKTTGKMVIHVRDFVVEPKI